MEIREGKCLVFLSPKAGPSEEEDGWTVWRSVRTASPSRLVLRAERSVLFLLHKARGLWAPVLPDM